MSKQEPLTADELRSLLAQHGGWTEAARVTGRSASQIRSRASDLGIRVRPEDSDASPAPSRASSPSATIETGKDTASAEFVEATVTPGEVPTDGELLKRANLDPKIWEVISRRQSVWEAQAAEGEIKTMRSLRISYGKIKGTMTDAILPAFGGQPLTIKAPKRVARNERDSKLVIVLSDFHAPFHDRKLLDVTEQVLLEVQPDQLIINGDLVDFPQVSRHGKDTEDCWVSANECIQAGGEILGRLIAAVPDDCEVTFIPGNHDGWLSKYLYRQAGAAANLCVSGSTVPVWSFHNLLRFEELGIKMVGKEDGWQQATLKLTDELVVRHGLTVRAGSAASVIANLKSATFASITGHTHRQGIAGVTRTGASRRHKIFQGAEIGGMFQMPKKETDWPTYMAHDKLDWQPGWASVTIEADKHYGIDLASWQNGVLMWKGKRW